LAIRTVESKSSNDYLIWKYPNREIEVGSQVIVNESEEALLFENGQLIEILDAGRHVIESGNIPGMDGIIRRSIGNNSPIKIDVWFVSKVVSTDAELTNKPAHFKAVALGLATQLSNPKTAIVFSSVFAAMLPVKVPTHTTSILVMGVFVLNFSWYFLVSILLSSPKAQANYLRFKSYINKGSSVLMGSIGSKFVAEGFKP